MRYQAILVTPAFTILDPDRAIADPERQAFPTPTDAYAAGVDGLAEKLARFFDTEGVVLVDGPGARALRMSEGWTTVETKSGPRVYVGNLDKLGDAPLSPVFRSPVDTLGAFTAFHKLTGVAWHRSSGVAGLSLLQQMHPLGKSKPIVWKTDGPDGANEVAYNPASWRRESADGASGAWIHGMDRRKAGLASFTTLEVARYGLRHQPGKKTYSKDERLAGWLYAAIPVWNDPRMPDPAGPCYKHGVHRPGQPCTRWITHITADLLNELADEGVSEGVRFVRDAWLAPRSKVFANWAAKISRALVDAERAAMVVDQDGYPTSIAQDMDRAYDAVKAMYSETAGMLTGANSWVKRHDWYSAHVAMNRANPWRRAWEVGKQTGHWPVMVDGDKWWYRTDIEDGEKFAEQLSWDTPEGRRGIVLGEQLGKWRHDGTRAVRVRAEAKAAA